jgi:hypothetical protein
MAKANVVIIVAIDGIIASVIVKKTILDYVGTLRIL